LSIESCDLCDIGAGAILKVTVARRKEHRSKMHCARAVFLLPVNVPLVLPQQTRFPVANFEKLKLQTSNLRLKNPEQLQNGFICFYTFAPRSFGLAPTAKNIMKVDSLRLHIAIEVTLLLSVSCFVKTANEKHVYEEWKNKEWQKMHRETLFPYKSPWKKR